MPRPKGSQNKAVSLKDYFKKGEAQKLWKEAKEKAKSGFQNIDFDDGKYQVQLVDAFSGVSQNGRVQNAFVFQFLNGDYKGKKISKYQGVENQVGQTILIQDFGVMGIEIDEPEQIDDANKKLKKSKPTLEIRIKTNGEYKNISILRELEEVDSDEENDEEEKEDVTEDEDAGDAKTEEIDEDDENEESEEDEDSDTDTEDEEEDEDSDDKFPMRKKNVKEEDAEESEEDEDSDSDDDEDEDEEKSTKEVDLEIGMKVKATYKKGTITGKVVGLYEDEGEIKIKQANGEKVRVSADSVIDVL